MSDFMRNTDAFALGMEADVTILDRSLPRLRELDAIFAGKARCIYSSRDAIEKYALDSDLIIGAVLVPGAAAPKLLTRDIIRRMRPGSVVVDVAIDQGGCFETSKPTTHTDPTFVVDEVVHYCVANMPGAVPHTSTYGLTNVTLPYAVELANRGWRDALRRDPALARGLNTHDGVLTYAEVGEAHGLPVTPLAEVLA